MPFKSDNTSSCSRDLVTKRRGDMIELVLPVAPLWYLQPFFVTGPPLRRSWVHAEFEMLAAAALTANRSWLPVVTEAVPYSSLLLVPRTVVFAIANVFEWQIEFLHETASFQATSGGVFEGPRCFEVAYYFKGFLHERGGVGQFLICARFGLAHTKSK